MDKNEIAVCPSYIAILWCNWLSPNLIVFMKSWTELVHKINVMKTSKKAKKSIIILFFSKREPKGTEEEEVETYVGCIRLELL